MAIAPASAQADLLPGVTASFDYSPGSPLTGQPVNFTSTSLVTGLGNVLASEDWDLDDDGNFNDASGSSASQSFSSAGPHVVRLRAMDIFGNTDVASQTVTVASQPPTASFNFSPASPSTGQTVNFTSTSTDPEGTNLTESWDLDGDNTFGDATGATAQKDFATPGPHTVRLRVTDADSQSDTIERTVTVANRLPTAAFDFSPASPSSGETVSFTSSSSDPDGSIALQEWDLDNDGNYNNASGGFAQRSFAGAGTYTVGLRVTDNDGGVATTSRSVTVANRLPTASFGYSPGSPNTGDTITFTSTSTDPEGTTLTQTWDLDGDNTFGDATGGTVQRTFNTSGPHTVGLRVTDGDGGTDTVAQTVTVANRPPAASFDFSPTSPNTGQSVTFTSHSTDPDGSIAGQAWDLDNDGNFNDGTAASVSRSFATAGTYTVKLRATDNGGAINVATQTVTVANRLPTAAFDFTPATPSSGQSVTFTSSSTDPDGSLVSQQWDLDNDGNFNDGNAGSAARSFPSAGTYTVKLRVTDNNGGSSVASRTVPVGNRPPAASFDFSPVSPLSGQDVTFTSTATDPDGTLVSQVWDLDNDGNFDEASGGSVQRSFPSSGSYTVKLRVTDNDGDVNTASRTVTVANRTPTASFDFSPASPQSGQSITFTSTSIDQDGPIKTYAWDFDNDGLFNDASTATVTRSFSAGGTYPVKLRVTDNDGATDVATRTVTVANQAPTAAFDYSPATPVTGQQVTFTSRSTDVDGTVTLYAWDTDNDGVFDDGGASTAKRTFSAPGTYTVRLRIEDNSGASATTERTITMGDQPPVAAFQVSPASPATGDLVSFVSTSTDPDDTIASQTWDLDNDGLFDDGAGVNVTRTFPTAGIYTVRLLVVDSHGASSIAVKQVTITNRPPVSTFTYSPTAPTALDPVTFTSTATDPDGTITSQTWDLDNDGFFDDGSGPTAQRTFPTGGTYTVKLRVVDNAATATVSSQTVTVGKRAPVASFTFTPAAPQTLEQVTFISTSTDADGSITTQQWDLDNDGLYDDGTGATVKKTFLTQGHHTVKLRVVDNDGMEAFATQAVLVGNRPPSPSFTFSPGSPIAGQTVNFFSTSSDPDGPLTELVWDLDSDGQFDDATGGNAARSFAAAGTYTVNLRVTDDTGVSAIATRSVVVRPQPPPAAPAAAVKSGPALLSPFPVVRLSGTITRRGARLSRLSITMPPGSLATVRCSGRGCPFKLSRKTSVARKPGAKAASEVRMRRLERKVLRFGTKIQIFVTRADAIGKYTRFSIKRGKPPVRIDRCLPIGSMRPTTCPA